jgi:hypothetical protein
VGLLYLNLRGEAAVNVNVTFPLGSISYYPLNMQITSDAFGNVVNDLSKLSLISLSCWNRHA